MITPSNLLDGYIQRLVEDLPDDLRGLATELSEVVYYPEAVDWGLEAPPDVWAFLCDVGLPKSCPTMIDLDTDAQDLGNYIRIGSTNYGDSVCIEKSRGAVVYLEYEGYHSRHQINTSPLTFLGSICAYDKSALQATREAIRGIDPDAVSEGRWWHAATL
ncbi:SUKH-4 family immunity protein [Verrucomicrobiaceae bacterium N1E253]|uniref:SUKH-4 family immunity protein n=1 Tax=Oceaniferula marina TaxID=2748318 RepID=A0A851GJP6_9BACT|nr:SUKH-4 family immunity protein [Oceaniferula marina]